MLVYKKYTLTNPSMQPKCQYEECFTLCFTLTLIVTVYVIQDSELPHLLDPMHIEKNIIVALTKMLSNAKGAKSDSLGVRQEMQARNMMPALHPRETDEVDREGRPLYRYATPAPWVWTSSEFELVLGTLKHICAPSNYGSSLSYKIKRLWASKCKIGTIYYMICFPLPLIVL